MSTDPEDSAVVMSTVVDGDSLGTVFLFRSGEISTSRLTGLTITGGFAQHGGGIQCDGSSPTISKNRIRDNYAEENGGGIYCFNGSMPTILDNRITGNSAASTGGGIDCRESTPTITDCVIKENSAGDAGGGIACSDPSNPVITGNTISQNYADGTGGGGIYCFNGSAPRISNNTIKWNTSISFGGGINCMVYSSPTIFDNNITHNLAAWGGGINNTTDSHPTITDNTIEENEATLTGGGINCNNYSSPVIADNTIKNNSTTGFFTGGGGITCSFSSSPIITRNDIIGNSALTLPLGFGYGGGIECGINSSPMISNNTIKGNMAGSYGGGISCNDYSSPTIVNNSITNNSVSGSMDEFGGGISCSGSSTPEILNCVIANNTAIMGGGIHCQDSSFLSIINSTLSENNAQISGGGITCENAFASLTNAIFWNNHAPIGPEISITGTTEPCTLTINYSDVEGGLVSTNVDSLGAVSWGPGMIETDPLFLDPDSDDFHLQPTSPCIDAGDSTILDECLPPGLGSDRSDMGAYGGEKNCDWLEPPVYLLFFPEGPDTVSGGNIFRFGTFIGNTTNDTTSGNYWVSILLPNSNEITIPENLLNYPNPLEGKVAPLGFIRLHNELYIPPMAAINSYSLVGRIGIHPNNVMDERMFDFEVVE
jgi:parallel beta-helix repeat protein